jgi:molecular chaperone HscA
MQARMLKEQQVEASRVIESVQAALLADSKLLTTHERTFY